MRRVLPETVASDIGRLDPAAIEEVRKDAWPDVRDAEELHDALETLIASARAEAHQDNSFEINDIGASSHLDPLELAVVESNSSMAGIF